VGLIVNEVISASKLVADSDKVEVKLQELAASYGEPDQVVEWYRSNPEQMGNIEMSVLEDQVVDHIISDAEVEEVVASYADVISGSAIAPEPEEDASNEVDAKEAEKED
jgi:trigger factor